MGACVFMTMGNGKNAEDAFRAAQEQAAWDHGHGGYTGTIAEKHAFVMIVRKPLAKKEAVALADKLINDDDDERVSDKWGPAGCIPIDGGGFLFFGWASS